MAAASDSSARTEQIMSQFLLKSLHVILSSRIPTLRSDPPRARPSKNRDRWFNLALGDIPATLDSLGSWHRFPLDPLVVDVLLSSHHDSLLERWTLHYHHTRSGSSPSPADPSKTYKKTMILLRSIYSLLRILPAYKAFRMLTSSNQNCNFSLNYKVSSFAEPLSSSDDHAMESWTFAPVDTQFGQLSASLTYRAALDDLDLEASPLLPPRIITNYVGSPAAEPLRAFPSSVSGSGVCSTTFPMRGERYGAPLARPHSWASPPLAHFPLGTSPPEPRFSPPVLSGRQVTDIHNLYRTASSGSRRTGISAEESRISPPFSDSPTPSPPLYSNSPLRNRLQSESSPVSIPMPAGGRNLLHRTPSDPMRSFLPPPSPRSARVEAAAAQESPSEGRSYRKIEGFRTGEPPSSLPSYVLTKGVKDVKEESGRFSGILSSGNSPRIGFSRSSSRLSFTDDLDNCEFSCPFAVDDIDTPDSQTRNTDGKDGSESSQPYLSTRKSQDCAVGVLVRMLRNAPPLRQDSCSSQSSRSEFGGDAGSSSYFLSRKTSDALEELRSYQEMKDMLLSQSGSKFLDPMDQRSQ